MSSSARVQRFPDAISDSFTLRARQTRIFGRCDPAAIFAAASSLSRESQRQARTLKMELSFIYQGWDEFMRETMRVAGRFEEWACDNVAFDELAEPWPYLLEDHFGQACLAVVTPDKLRWLDNAAFRFVANRMNLTLQVQAPEPPRA